MESPGASVFSAFDVYSHEVQLRMASSPLPASTWNSCVKLPPMAPLSASTGRNFTPRRVKMRL